jgi:hypothetical protein
MRLDKSLVMIVVLGSATAGLAADVSWLKHVPDTDRKRVNPVAGQPDATTAERESSRIIAQNATAQMPWATANDRAFAARGCKARQTARFSGC